MNKLGQDLYEVETYKTCISVDTPIQIGFFNLQYAKLRILQFYYDCLNLYLKKNSFELFFFFKFLFNKKKHRHNTKHYRVT